MRNISCSLTKAQIRARTKTVTRRMGWQWLVEDVAKARAAKTPLPRLQVCEKCMGRKKGEPLVRMCVIEIIKAELEPLSMLLDLPSYGKNECAKEGFPDWTPQQFVKFFCASHKHKDGKPCTPESTVTRIEFRYVD